MLALARAESGPPLTPFAIGGGVPRPAPLTPFAIGDGLPCPVPLTPFAIGGGSPLVLTPLPRTAIAWQVAPLAP